MGCGGSGTTIGTSLGVYQELGHVNNHAPFIHAVANSGDTIGSIADSGEYDSGYSWTGTSYHRLGIPAGTFSSISPNGTWIVSMYVENRNTNPKVRIVRSSRSTGETNFASDPMPLTGITEIQIADDGTVAGVGMIGHAPETWCKFAWSGSGTVSTTQGYPYDLVLPTPPDTTLYMANAFSHNGQFACGSVEHTVDGKWTSEGIVWNLTAGTYELTGTPDIPSRPYSSFYLSHISDDGKSGIGSIRENWAAHQLFGNSFAGIWHAGSIPQKTIEFVHQQGQGSNYDTIEPTSQYISPDGKVLAGFIWSSTTSKLASFTYRQH